MINLQGSSDGNSSSCAVWNEPSTWTCGTTPCFYTILGCVLGGFIAFALGLPCFLLALGFGAIGIAAGSVAACFQGSCGTPICFRAAQSAAMTGLFPWPWRLVFGVVGAVVMGAIAAYLPPCADG